MHTLARELRALHADAVIDDATASRALARDCGDVFTVHMELRAAMYAGVLLAVTGVGLVLARNLDRIGPFAILFAIALAAVIAAVPAMRARVANRPLAFVDDYLLLLAVLLASAGLAYAERQFALLGPLWSWHLLLLAAVHAIVAYASGSSLVLAASLTSLAGWFGMGSSVGDVLNLSHATPALGTRALACAALIVAWRHVDRRARLGTTFSGVFEHFAANIAFWGALAWCLEWPWLAAGLPLLAVLAYVSVRHGLGTGREAFLVYGILYAALGLCVVVVPRLHGMTVSFGFVLLVVCIAAATLWHLRGRLREPAT